MPHVGWEDWDMWLKLFFADANIIYINKVFFNYRVLNDSMIRSHKPEKHLETRKYIILKHFNSFGSMEKVFEFYNLRHMSMRKIIELAGIKLSKKLKRVFAHSG